MNHTVKDNKSKKILLTRYGGIGDVAPVMVVAEQLERKGHEVHMALREDPAGNKQIDLLQNTKFEGRLMTYKQHGPWGTRCVKSNLGWIDIRAIYNRFDEVVDFMNIVEGNSTSPHSPVEQPCTEWRRSRSSNFVNWFDLHLSWANLDPNKVSDDEKRPKFKLSKDEIKWGKQIKKGHSHLFVISPYSSSLARSWYQAKYLPQLMLEKYPKALVALWDASTLSWVAYTASKTFTLPTPQGSSYRASMALVGASNAFVGVDTGFTHIAEGLDIPHVALYSTVPWWTRAKYYKNQVHIDMGEKNPEFYTFSLSKGDPLNIKDGMDGLNERERLIIAMDAQKVDAEVACRELNTTPNGLDMEFQALIAKQQSWEEMQAKALTAITPEMVMEKVEELCQK